MHYSGQHNAGNVTLIAGKTGKQVQVESLTLARMSGSGDILFKSSAVTLTPGWTPTETAPLVLPFNGKGWFMGKTGAALSATVGTGTTVHLLLDYEYIDP